MKKQIVLLLLTVISGLVAAQTDTTDIQVKNISLDQLKGPENPAFVIMNTTPTEISEPGSAPEFYTSIQNASDNFSVIPNNYGFSVTPFWWGKQARRLSFEKEYRTDNSITFWRTTTFSGGIVQGIDNNEDLWRYGMGFHSTILRGKVDVNRKNAFLDNLWRYHKEYHGDIHSFFMQNTEYNSLLSDLSVIKETTDLKIRQIDEQFKLGEINEEEASRMKKEAVEVLKVIQNRLDSLKNVLGKRFDEKQKYVESTEAIEEALSELDERSGLKWAIGGGIAINSQDNKTDSTGLYRAGFWTDIGGNLLAPDSSSCKLAGFILARYLYYNEINYLKDEETVLLENLHMFDVGYKLEYEVTGKFTLGMEVIYRVGLTGSIYEDSWKLNSLAEYYLGNNRLVYVSLGNMLDEGSGYGPDDLVVTIGINIGFGDNIDIYDFKL